MSAAQNAADEKWRPAANPWVIALTVTLVAFMEVLDTTIVNVALPHIAGSLSASTDDATWTLTSYLVANGIVLPISGFFSRLFGRKRYFLICIGMFTVCSFLCGISNSLAMLILARLAQGFFGGGLQPNQQAIILDTFEPAKRGLAFSITAFATIVAPVIGPTLGGYITDNYSWRWIFFINIPIGLFTVITVSALVEDPPWITRTVGRVKTDWVGLFLIVLGFGCLQIFMDRGEDADWFSSSFIRVFAGLALFGLSAASVWLWNAKDPVVRLSVLKDRNFAAGSIAIFALGFLLYASAIIIPQFAQGVLGYTALLAGLILSPGGLVIIFLIPIVSRLLPRVQTRYLIAFGMVALGCSFIYSHILTPQMTFLNLALIRASQTVGLAFLFVPISTIAYSTLPKRLSNDATSLYTMFRNVGGSVGISTATALVTQHTQAHMAHLSVHLTQFRQAYVSTYNQINQHLLATGHTASQAAALTLGYLQRQLIAQSSILAYSDVFLLSAYAAFAVVPVCFLFTPTKAGNRNAPPAH